MSTEHCDRPIGLAKSGVVVLKVNSIASNPSQHTEKIVSGSNLKAGTQADSSSVF